MDEGNTISLIEAATSARDSVLQRFVKSLGQTKIWKLSFHITLLHIVQNVMSLKATTGGGP